MERRKIIKKNESRSSKLKLPLTLYFFSKPLLYKTFKGIAKEKGIPMGKLIMSFASLGLKAYLTPETGETGAFKEEVPVFERRLAEIDSPFWYDSLGEEYKWIEGKGWLVTNEKIGKYHIRNICKIVETVKVEPDSLTASILDAFNAL